ncbi:MAG: carbohydrate kinase [Proteobacteria bacterium]|nr:carbohydrate kinase [Pseudomonadota bacterium]MBU1687770.1 carbohydrate kinase [Pseudomonadota bacterium]
MAKDLIISIGEIVWDQFPNRSVLGGAPLNVGYHLQARDLSVLVASRIGADAQGRKTLARLHDIGLAVDAIQIDDHLPTGRVLVSMDGNNEPHFEIEKPAAWDHIQAAGVENVVANQSFHLVCGTLAQRDKESRQTIRRLWQQATTIFYDVNLRPPDTPLDHVRASLIAAQVVKVNREELAILNQALVGAGGREEEVAAALLAAFDLKLLAVTRGSEGALLINSDGYHTHPGFKIIVADTVGSGDAFFSGIIAGYLTGADLKNCLEEANRLGAYVASRSGATPDYP